ncbi:MAG TPA: glycosyltransferase family 9 protein [Candidatus Eisenbacteria bacterium]|nr:glycosyltransferase family 9 protein [Candidatus Eisenbacteria bacterium]
MRSPRKPAKRALILFPGALGDFVCFLPALRTIARGARVDLLAKSEFADLVPPAVTVYSLNAGLVGRLFMPRGGERPDVQRFFAPYDVVYSWFGAAESVFARELKRATQGKGLLFPFRPTDGTVHQSDHYLSCLGETGSSLPIVTINGAARAWCDRYWLRHELQEKPVLALAPGSGAREKNWPVAFFRVIADWWRRESGGAVIVVLGPVEEERGGFEALQDVGPVSGALRLGQLAALLSRSAAYVGNDSGTTHLAAAVGVSTVALFGPTDPDRWEPRGRRVAIVRRRLSCSPCAGETMKHCDHRSCLAALDAADVMIALGSAAGIGSGSRSNRAMQPHVAA